MGDDKTIDELRDTLREGVLPGSKIVLTQLETARLIDAYDRLRDEVERLKRRNEELETAFRTLRDTHELVRRLTKVIEWFENSEEE